MREFPQKLSASGWDLGGVKTHPTTGFSGTADSSYLLPLNVKQLEKVQNPIEAWVLGNIMRRENRIIRLAHRTRSPTIRDIGVTNMPGAQSSDAEDILRLIVGQNDMDLRVILDVGAQILELTNVQVAKKWLSMATELDPTIEAAVYVNDDEEIMVMGEKGAPEQLNTSAFADRLDVCIVFLDEAHTRGIDLKLPSNYRAAVLLGANLTRDKLVQG